MRQRHEATEEQLSNVIAGIAAFALCSAFVTIVVYTLHFWGSTLSDKQEAWGQFGDYVGGLLNPIIALCALVLLALGTQIQRRILRETRSQAERARFATEWGSMVTLLADVKHRDSSAKLIEIASSGILRLSKPNKAMESQASEVLRDKNVSRAIVEAMTVVRPVLTLITSLVELVKSEAIPLRPDERERYMDVIRAFLTTEDGIVILAATAEGQIPAADVALMDRYELFSNMHSKTLARVKRYIAALRREV
jgi:hypothetical protein